ncbi:CAP domain-containing protein [Flavobacterium ichthyis]|nr:CAP domain-containing protein [Flavobacterium ichthyis]
MLRALLPVALVFVMFSCSSDSDSETSVLTAEEVTLVTEFDYDEFELRLMSNINDYRKSKNLPELLPIAHISYKSEEHNEFMIANNVVSHDNFEERSQNLIQVLGAYRVSENVAYNFNSTGAVLNAWLASPGHKANIEGDFSHFGIAVSINPETGRKYYTNMFIKK